MKFVKHLCISLIYLFMNCSMTQVDQFPVEAAALDFVVEKIIEQKLLLEFNDEFLKKYPIDLEGLLEANAEFHASGRSCILSTINKVEDELSESDDLTTLRGLISDRKSKATANNVLATYKLPSRVKKTELEEFKKLTKENSFFLTVRHHLEFKDIYLIEINAARLSELPNLSQFVFYVYLDKDLKVTSWDFAQGYGPRSSDRCE